MRTSRALGVQLMGVWLVGWGLFQFVPIITGLNLLLGLLAVVAGLLILTGR